MTYSSYTLNRIIVGIVCYIILYYNVLCYIILCYIILCELRDTHNHYSFLEGNRDLAKELGEHIIRCYDMYDIIVDYSMSYYSKLL